jgi:hypothetical protein
MEINVLPAPDGNVVARGSYYGGPDYEFVVVPDGQVYFRAVGDSVTVWAGPDADSFRRIVEAWKRYGSEFNNCSSEAAETALFGRMREEFARLGALPDDLPPDPEPLWSLLLSEAENGLG